MVREKRLAIAGCHLWTIDAQPGSLRVDRKKVLPINSFRAGQMPRYLRKEGLVQAQILCK